jgi:hypothetical protein
LIFTWFDAARDVEASFVPGHVGFRTAYRPIYAPHVQGPEEKTVLEIGYGGGRILAAASRAFAMSVGVDIHDRHEIVAAEFRARGIENFSLLQCDE